MRQVLQRFGSAVGVIVLFAVGCADDASEIVEPDSTTASEQSPPSVVVPAPAPTAIGGADSGVNMTTVQDQLPEETPRRDLPKVVPDLEVWSGKVVDLPDGRSLVLGRADDDEPIETSTRFLTAEGYGDPVLRHDAPIRLFVVDWEAETFAAISAIPDTHEFSNATGEHLFAEVVLEFSVEPDGETVRYSAGWNGAGYDFPYSLWLAEIPAT